MTSKIKVDNINKVSDDSNIINKCGTTITLGASGDSINLAAGASQSGFGRTGTVDWITTPKVTGDSPVTGVSGKGYFMNTSGGAITLNLPAGSAGDIISLADYSATWDTYNVTVQPNGSEKIGGAPAQAILNTVGQSLTFVYVDAVQGWVNTMDSTSNVRGNAYIGATVSGACNTITTCGNCKVATFKNPGSFVVSTLALCSANDVLSYMVVGGGGSGLTRNALNPCGTTRYSTGGGGAGGFRELKTPISPYTASPLDGYPTPGNRITATVTTYPITVGGGGAAPPSGGTGAQGASGSNSIFSTITAAGGGGGGMGGPAPSYASAGNTGGSGGGGGAGPGGKCGGVGNTPPTTPAQGKDGGPGSSSADTAAGGGGGAGCAGSAGVGTPTPRNSVGGDGGGGVTTHISGAAVIYAGGGGGGAGYPCGTPNPTTGGGAGPGGGGVGGDPTRSGANGTDFTGGGGGGAGGISPTAPAGGGGSGIVVIRYKFQ